MRLLHNSANLVYWKIINVSHSDSVQPYVFFDYKKTSDRLYRMRANRLLFANSKWTETDEMTLFAYVCIKTHTCNKVNQAEIFFTDEYTPDDVIVDLYDFIVENRAMISSKIISSDEKIQSMNIRSIDINRFYSPAIPIDYSVVVDVKTDTVHRTFGLIFGRKGGSFFLRSLDEIYK